MRPLLFSLLLVLPVAAAPQTAPFAVCPAQPLAPRSAGGPPVYLPCQLDREPRIHGDSLAVAYPPLLQQAGIEGLARVQVIVTRSGALDSASVTVTGSMHRGFEPTVRRAAWRMHFDPGIRGGEPVASLVTVDFEFALGEGLRSGVALDTARALARRADASMHDRVVALRRVAAILAGRVVRVFPFDAPWDGGRGRPAGGCGAYRVYVSPPLVAGPPLAPGVPSEVRAFADSLAADTTAPAAVRAAAYCLAANL
ncbi:MAG TPA: TonB family protein [Gemmatimonadales bacterium]|nr:TonB family protein [Gemmatimonadales bacterium]